MNDKKYVWTVATGNVDPLKKASRKAVELVKGLEGFVAVHSHYPHGTLWLFDSLNNAKGARNQMEAKGIQCGTNICRGWINGSILEIEGVKDD